MMGTINWLAVVAGTVLYVVHGAFWYSPALFGTIFMREHKISAPDKSDMTITYAGSMLNGFLVSVGVACLSSLAHTYSLFDGFLLGLIISTFFVLPIQLSPVLWTKKSLVCFFTS